jgi:hypothetical protein
MGNSWGGYYLATPNTWSNDWEYVEFDLKAEQAALSYPDEPVRFAICLFADGPFAHGNANPIPWSGYMFDNLKIYTVFPGAGGDVVATTTIAGPLAPGEEETISLCWTDATYCNHGLVTAVNYPGDMNSFNDECSDFVRVTDHIQIKEFSSLDLTEEGDCLWHLCETRGGGDNNYAWAGIEEVTWAHYVNNMDDSFISPPINLTGHTMGAALNFTTWYEFADINDFGELYVRNATSEAWILLKEWFTNEDKVSGHSGGFFEDRTYYIAPEHCTYTTQFRFRMRSDSSGVSKDGT